MKDITAQPDAHKIDAHAIVRRYLEAIGAEGLCNAEAECGCRRDDLAPCECGPTPDCYPAREHTLCPDEYIGDAGPGDTIYIPL